MEKLKIPYIPELDEIEVELASSILDKFGSEHKIDMLNWADKFPYKPITYFNIGRSKESIFIKYLVNGTMLKAIYSADQEPVHEDSCVEFFCKMPDSESYINFEFNCIGTCKSARRTSRINQVYPLTTEELIQIKRYPALGRRAFKEMEGMFEWDLTVKIPMSIIGIDPSNLPEKLLGNFYKCADGTDSPHYVTWNPIKSVEPDFHRPEFFGELYF